MATKEEQSVLYWIKHLGDEFEYIGTSPLQAKFKIMLLMVYVDIFSQVWSLVTESHEKPFAVWSNEFIFSEANNYFVNHRDEFYALNGESLYKIRNSLLHFGSLPNYEIPIFITETDNRQQFYRRYPRQIGEQEVVVLYPTGLFSTVAQAIIRTLETISEIEKSNPRKYKKIMTKIYKKLQKEIALPIRT